MIFSSYGGRYDDGRGGIIGHPPPFNLSFHERRTKKRTAALANPRRLFWILHARIISIPGIELRLQSAIIQPAAECNNRSSFCLFHRYIRVSVCVLWEWSFITITIENTWDVYILSLSLLLLRDRMQLYGISCHEGKIGETWINTPGLWKIALNWWYGCWKLE